MERSSSWSVGYTDNDDILVVGSSNSRARINHLTGAVVWKTTIIASRAGTEGFANDRNTFYGIHGAINQPKRLFAMDIDSGTVKYYSDALPGDADQENPMMRVKWFNGCIKFQWNKSIWKSIKCYSG